MGKMTPYEAWQIVSKMVDKTYTNQDYDDAVEIIREAIARFPNTDSTRVTDADVQKASECMEIYKSLISYEGSLTSDECEEDKRSFDLAITALEQYRKPEPCSECVKWENDFHFCPDCGRPLGAGE